MGGKAAADEPAEEDSAPHKYILIGLHTCGDLAHKVLFFFPKRVLEEHCGPPTKFSLGFFVFCFSPSLRWWTCSCIRRMRSALWALAVATSSPLHS